jgi:hypothetical protein
VDVTDRKWVLGTAKKCGDIDVWHLFFCVPEQANEKRFLSVQIRICFDVVVSFKWVGPNCHKHFCFVSTKPQIERVSVRGRNHTFTKSWFWNEMWVIFLTKAGFSSLLGPFNGQMEFRVYLTSFPIDFCLQNALKTYFPNRDFVNVWPSSVLPHGTLSILISVFSEIFKKTQKCLLKNRRFRAKTGWILFCKFGNFTVYNVVIFICC